VLAWFKRFGLHLAAAVGATGIFVAAAAVGASQTRQQTTAAGPPTVAVGAASTPGPRPKPSVVASPSPDPRPTRVVPERSLAGTVQSVSLDEVEVRGVGGRLWHVVPALGALIRLNGKAARADSLQAGDTVVILGQAQVKQGPGNHFLAHAITARRK
jgi:hypothetical protein